MLFIFFYNLCCSAVLKLLKMATGMRALLDTVMQALPQVKPDALTRDFWFINDSLDDYNVIMEAVQDRQL